MNQWTTQSGITIYQVLNKRSNAFIVKIFNIIMLIDTGKTSDYSTLCKNINKLNISSIDYLCLTHTHFDHCQNASKLKKKYNCKIIAGESECGYTEQGKTPVPNGTTTITKLIARIARKVNLKATHYKSFSVDNKISHSIDISIKRHAVKIIPTQGHSSGSISVILDNEIAIVGDTLFGIFPGKTFPPYANDKIQLLKSWKKLLAYPCKLYLPGHGNEIKRQTLEKNHIKRTYQS